MAWTTIAAGNRDVDTPVFESTIEAIFNNAVYNFEHAVRCGSHDAPARLAFAAGDVLFAEASAGADHEFTSSVTFSTDSLTGDPNFSATPTIYLVAWEITSGGYTAWSNTLYAKSLYIQASTPSSSGFSFDLRMENAAATSISTRVLWVAIGPVTAGE